MLKMDVFKTIFSKNNDRKSNYRVNVFTGIFQIGG